MSGVLLVGAGRDQRSAIVQARERGLHVVAVDRDPHAEGLAHADVAEVAGTDDAAPSEEIARRHAIDGALAVGLCGAVPVVTGRPCRRTRSRGRVT